MTGRSLALALLAVFVGTGRAPADDATRLDDEKAQLIAKLCTAADAAAKNAAPLKIAPDLERAVGFDLKKRAVLALPTRNLTAATIAKADKEIVPVGVLYMYRITPVVADDPLGADRLRTFDIKPQDGKPELTISAAQLAVTRVAGRLVLLVYAGAKEPVVVTTLVESGEAGDVPLDLEVAAAGEGRGLLIVRAFGKYRAAITVAALD